MAFLPTPFGGRPNARNQLSLTLGPLDQHRHLHIETSTYAIDMSTGSNDPWEGPVLPNTSSSSASPRVGAKRRQVLTDFHQER